MPIYSEFSHQKLQFSIAMFVYQRVFVVEGGTYAGTSGKLKVGEMMEIWHCIIP